MLFGCVGNPYFPFLCSRWPVQNLVPEEPLNIMQFAEKLVGCLMLGKKNGTVIGKGCVCVFKFFFILLFCCYKIFLNLYFKLFMHFTVSSLKM